MPTDLTKRLRKQPSNILKIPFKFMITFSSVTSPVLKGLPNFETPSEIYTFVSTFYLKAFIMDNSIMSSYLAGSFL